MTGATGRVICMALVSAIAMTGCDADIPDSAPSVTIKLPPPRDAHQKPGFSSAIEAKLPG